MSVENDPGFWKWLVGVGGSASLAIVGAWKFIDAKLEKKADKDSVVTEFVEVRKELGVLRGNQGKVFDQIRENEQRAQDRHERLMERLPNVARD